MNPATLAPLPHLNRSFSKNPQAPKDASQGAYLLGKSTQEPERLIKQAELYRPEARQMLESVNLKPGERALDLGCGPLGILDEMAKRVGSTGHVTGLEREDRYRAYAEAEVRRGGFDHVNVIAGDARHTHLPNQNFDLAHARLLLVNVPRPQEVVNELVRVTKVGGTVALHEVDWSSWTCDPLAESWTRIKDAARNVWSQNGLDVHIGNRLPEMLGKAGITNIQVQRRCYVWRAGDIKHTFLLAILKRIRNDIAEAGLLSETEIDTFERDLAAHLADPNTRVLSPTYVQAWGVK
tara:strand:- start:6570 stop:7451 length:882 start_codon:yes stop_codon:yes gene_type:complete